MIDCKDLVGIPFKVHGRDKNGFDCYGLALYILNNNNINLPDVFYDEINYENNSKLIKDVEKCIKCKKIDTPKELCIIEFSVYGIPAHIGIYIGDGYFIHASRSERMVCIERLSKWKKRVVGYYDVTDCTF